MVDIFEQASHVITKHYCFSGGKRVMGHFISSNAKGLLYHEALSLVRTMWMNGRKYRLVLAISTIF